MANVCLLVFLTVCAHCVLADDDVEIQEIMKELAEQKLRIQMLESHRKNDVNIDDLLPLRRASGNYSDTVAFSAALGTTFDSSGHNSPILFDVVHSNAGNGYSAATGTFTCPKQGLYLIQTSVAVAGDDGIHGDLEKDGQKLCGSPATRYTAGSCMVIVPLAVGDHVWVRDQFGKHVRGDLTSTFNGFLILSA